MTTRVLVCCDRVILGEGIRALLERHDMKVQVETTQRGSLATAAETGPDILVGVAPSSPWTASTSSRNSHDSARRFC
ncbi:hypothetical protein ACFQ2H_10005 [Streptomyces violaceoruber]